MAFFAPAKGGKKESPFGQLIRSWFVKEPWSVKTSFSSHEKYYDRRLLGRKP